MVLTFQKRRLLWHSSAGCRCFDRMLTMSLHDEPQEKKADNTSAALQPGRRPRRLAGSWC